MAIVTDGPMMAPERGIHELTTPLGVSIGAAASEAWADSPVNQLITGSEIARASGDGIDFGAIAQGAAGGIDLTEEIKPAAPRMDIIEANDRVRKAGLEKHLTLPDQPDIPPAQLEIMMRNAQARREREATMERGPQGFIPSALQVGTSFLVGAVDPINIASAFIPVMGELRYGKLLASAGESLAGRTGVRLGVGGAQGVVGQAALEPLDWWAHTQEGRDFGMADVLHNLLFGAALGGGLHAGGGGIRDVYRARKGLAQYPFGPGEPMEHVEGIHVPESVLAEQGVAVADMPAHLRPVIDRIDQVLAETPAMNILRDLPPRAQEDSMRAAIASIVEGEPVKVGELLDAAAHTDPRIAESFEAFHGSPHEFDAFDNSKIGTGEGAQVMAFGHYLAENQKVAEEYARGVTGEKGPRNVASRVFAARGDENLVRQRLQQIFPDITEPEIADALEFARSKPANLYKVRIKPEREQFLQWETNLTDQPAGRAILEKMDQKLRAALEEELERHDQPALDDLTGGMLHRLLERHASEGELPGVKGEGGHPKRDVSEYLKSLDVPGVVFLDQKSRKKQAFGDLDAVPAVDNPTRNFVVFDDKHIEIIDRNGEPVVRPFTESPAGNPKITLTDSDLVTAPKPRGRAAADPETWSLFEYLASRGGLKPDPELKAIFGSDRGPFVPGFGPLIRKGGMPLDEALRSAKDARYFFDAADVTGAEAKLRLRDLLDRIDDESRKRKVYRITHLPEDKPIDPDHEALQIVAALHDELESAAGQKGVHIDPGIERRVVEIIQKEGERDVLAAHERAIMEDTERYDAVAEARQGEPRDAVIPGWDVPDDAGAAQAAGGPAAGAGGLSGGPGQGEGGDAGLRSRASGAGDRAPPQTQLDKDAAWRRLAAATPDFDAPDVVAASNAAARAEPPKTKLDDRVAASEKAEAYARSMYDMFAHRLPPEERARLEEYIGELDRQKADRDTVTRRGAACLFEGGL